MVAYKLVVVDPFENYRRGDQILNQELVKKICDPKNELHHYERNVRRVVMSEVEKQMYIAPVTENKFPPQSEPVPAPSVQVEHVHIESIKDEMDA